MFFIVLKINIYYYIDRKILFCFRPKDPEDIGKAHSQLYVRGFQGTGALREAERSVGAVGRGERAPGDAGREDFPKVQFLDIGNLSQEETVEVVLVIT